MLKEQIKKDQVAALKAGDQVKRSALSMLLTAIQNKELAKRTTLSKTVSDLKELETASQLTDEEVVAVIGTEIKKRKESIEQFKAGNRPELAINEEREITYISIYMPPQLSLEELKTIVTNTIKEQSVTSVKDMGKVVGAVMSKVKGQAEGTLVSQLVKEQLNA